LFNAEGQLIGVVNAKSSGENIEGLGFAIPISDAQVIMTDLLEKGYVSGRVQLGFNLFEIQNQDDIRTYFKYSRYFSDYGVYIAKSEDPNFHEGDLLVAINDGVENNKIASLTDLKALLQKLEVGQTVSITVSRINGNKVQLYTYDLTLKEKKS
jgi:serine protease Do